MKPPIKDLKLAYYPTGDVTQWFGENPTLYARFGLAGHNGIDLVRAHGTPLYAVEDAEVVSVKNDPGGYGKVIYIISDKKNKNGFYNEWVYGHNSFNFVTVGQKVKAGEKIALMGNTGFVVSGATPYWKVNPFAGTHVHLGLRECTKLKSGGWSHEGSTMRIRTNNYSNGYKGAIDPRPFLEGLVSPVPEANKVMFAQLLTIQSLINTIKLRRALWGV